MITVLEKFRRYAKLNPGRNTLALGTRFGKLTINSDPFYRTDVSRSSYIFYECLCDCGLSTVVEIRVLQKNNTKSCGSCPRLCKICGAQATTLGNLYCKTHWLEYRAKFEPAHKMAKEASIEKFISTRLTSAKSRSKKSGRNFTITIDDVLSLYYIQSSRCAITNMLLEHIYNSPTAVTIDRIDSEKDYSVENIQLANQFANLAKHSHTNSDAIEFFSAAKSGQTAIPTKFIITRSILYRLCSKAYQSVGYNNIIKLLDQYQHRCAITGLPLTTTWNSLYTLSIDRIDSNLGYVYNNIQPVCQAINRGKCAHSNESIINFFIQLRQL